MCDNYNLNNLYPNNSRESHTPLSKKSIFDLFFPYDIEFWDSMKMARSTICKNKTYKYYTTNGRKSATAENLYKYISHNENFIESHTGLEDVLIESIILVKCLSYHKKMNKRLFVNK